ncbi:hypothetical protein [Sulfurimonas sp. CS5]|uniref:hypothetical protein n=1 Tax=Sulfurimonas sp. CS5 TaxID=3391145 RepID=UPI0039EC2DD5
MAEWDDMVAMGYDGFIFDSSRNQGGENIVIFEKDPEFKDYKIVLVNEINLSYESVFYKEDIKEKSI